ncbi:FecR family protein [Arundinibacter roseus]|uniref:FecR family protein n=1 Tax=Arundinibacter roseus TaxID=2070510 RepID=A0A4R4KID0_9BACT|nr:FecR family protein [Arundinibacter roseus]TDB67914.1 FecR family protein [Arundinibacter roseus]
MDHYKTYSSEDFVWDKYFRQWVLKPTRESDEEWNNWLAKNQDLRLRVQQAREIVNALSVSEHSLTKLEIDGIIQQTMSRLSASSPKLQRRNSSIRRSIVYSTGIRVPAILFAFIVLGGLVWFFTAPVNPQKTDGSVQTNLPLFQEGRLVEKSNFTEKPLVINLEDGSKIHLQKGSRIRYPEPFAKNLREIHLQGEAFFEVAKNPERPFWVYTQELVTKVLGTSFWIRAYDESKEIVVKVKTGRVSVFSMEGNKPQKKRTNIRERQGVILTPNQQIVFSRSEIRMVKSLVKEPTIITSNPVFQQFEFEDRPVSEVFFLLKKAYGVDIIYNEDLMFSCPLTANLNGLSLYQKLDVICKAVESEYEIIDGQIVIHGTGCKS